ncbi:MAG: hypothetical protein OEY19_04595 [Gammaproteobacteria bacterium]|nr:hypothetical protein [Gammaproteobacteria bacterium]MDH5630976.1 hypothetical protein [Gammaproteobacteria bacterium]
MKNPKMINSNIVKLLPAVLALGIVGCEGPPGPMGPAGQQGEPGISGYEVVVGETAVDNVASKQLRVDCPEGKKALGAGWSVLDPTSAILDGRATYFQPAFDGSHWLVNAQNKSGFAPEWKLRVRVICAVVAE